MLLEARDVTKAFGSFKAVDSASVTLEQGDILGLIGPNGAGKSTFFNCLTGDLISSSGKVFFQGHDITNLAPEARGTHCDAEIFVQHLYRDVPFRLEVASEIHRCHAAATDLSHELISLAESCPAFTVDRAHRHRSGLSTIRRSYGSPQTMARQPAGAITYAPRVQSRMLP